MHAVHSGFVRVCVCVLFVVGQFKCSGTLCTPLLISKYLCGAQD